nr:conserved hypothetical protein [Melanopsichium pennsylvanicum 4]
MLDTGLVSIIIKVAGIGLDQRDLGKTLGQMQIKLEKLNSMYGAHVCGEGGEYETLTINSPLFKKRLDVGETETVVHSDSAFGSVSYLRLKNARLVEKATEGKHAAKARTPPLLDKVGRRTLRAASNAIAIIENKRSSASFKHGLDCFKIRDHQPLPQPSIRRKGRYLVLSNIIGTPFTSTQDQVKSAFTTISSLLSTIPPSNSLDLSHISHINLYLSSQTLFPLINSVYRTMFGVSPPTRACVALPCLPQGVDLVINAIAFDDTLFSSNSTASQFDRRALHVQARSFWAPANIGPYSQSLVVAEKVWIAGQIGLVPADLTLPEGGRRETEQAALSVQHARRIFKATLGDMGGRSVDKGWVEGGLCWIEQGAGRIEVATRVWMAQAVELSHQEECQDDENQETREGEEQDEYWLGQTHLSGQGLPPMLFVTLPKGALPRSAVIEWQITAHTGRFPSSLLRDEHVPNKVGKHNEEEDDDDDDDDDEQEFIGSDVDDVIIHRTQAVLTSSNGTTFLVVHTITRSQDAKSQFGILCLSRLKRTQVEQESAEQTLTTSLRELVDRAYATQLFQPLEPHGAQDEALHLLETVLSQNDTEPKLLDKAQRIPCSCLHILSPDSTTQPVELAFVWHGI